MTREAPAQATEPQRNVRSTLMLAFNFPPLAQSTGRFRTLSFARHLPAHGWRPTVLTASERTYDALQPASMGEIPEGLEVLRAFGLDARRHFSIAGRYPRWIATPDRWSMWAIGAVWAGLRFVRARRPHVLWATYPIPSALLAAIWLHRLTRVPLVIDLRDPMVYEGWPPDPWRRRVFAGIERHAVHAASAIVCTTPGASALYRERYQNVPAGRFHVIHNGVEESAVLDTPPRIRRAGPALFVHSGLMEAPERDPQAFLAALRQRLDAGGLSPSTLRVVFRGTGRNAALRTQIAAHGLSAVVAVEPPVSHAQALAEMRSADALLLFQGRECNRQIPAKAYEYLACQVPIIGLVDRAGDTRRLVEVEWGVPYVADMDDASQIATCLDRFLASHVHGDAYVPRAELVAQYSRRARAGELARVFDTVVQI